MVEDIDSLSTELPGSQWLNLEVDEAEVSLEEELAKNLVHQQSHLLDVSALLLGSGTHLAGIIIIDEGITQRVILVGELNDGLLECGALCYAHALGEAACCNVTYNHLQGDDGYALYQQVDVVNIIHQVRGNATSLKHAVNDERDGLVETALVLKVFFLNTVECCGGVLVLHAQYIGVICREQSLGFAFVNRFHDVYCGLLITPHPNYTLTVPFVKPKLGI